MTDLEKYHILSTVHLSFRNGKKIKAVKHPENKMIVSINELPNTFKHFNKETFSIAVLLCQYTKDPSSIMSLAKRMNEISKEDIYKFRDNILHYKKYLSDDINYLKQKYLVPTTEEICLEFINNKIKFYTFYFFIINTHKEEDINKSRIYSIIWKKLQGLMLFVRFKEESIDSIMKELNSIFI